MRPAVAVSLEVIMGEMRIFRRPAVALVALAFPLVAVGAFALGTGYDLGGESTTTTAVVADTQQAPAEAQQTADPLSKARSSLNSASLPITFLSSGIGQLTEGGTHLNDGVGQLADGITQAHDGTIQLADGFGQYRDGIGQLGDGASQISGVSTRSSTSSPDSELCRPTSRQSSPPRQTRSIASRIRDPTRFPARSAE